MLKRLWSILLCLFLLSALWIPASATEIDEEPAIVTRKLEISTAEEFLEFAENCRLDSFSQHLEVYLLADIDLSGYTFDGVPTFSGTFWGKRHSISGISITADGSNQGLFRYLSEGAVVRDLTVEGQIQPGGSRGNVGAIIGTNSGEIRNCNFLGNVSGSDCVGGITGENRVTGVIENCTAEGTIHGDHFVGGIAGQNYGVIRNCENKAQINVTPQQNTVELSDITLQTITNSESVNTVTDIGGIAGISSGVIRDSINHGAVGYRQMGYNIGGIAGTQSGYIVNCENHGDVQGRKEVGGIVGQMEPVSVIEFTEDTLQILKGQLNAMSGMVNQVAGNAQTNANQITTQIALLKDQTQTAKNAVETLFPSEESPKLPNMDTILAAQNTLSKTVEAMPNTMRSIAAATQTTVSGLAQDLNALSGQISAMGSTLNNASANLGGSITDISDQDTPEQLTGKIENCLNNGAVLADLNAGGVVGAMAMENDLDITEDFQQLGDASLNFAGEIRVVLLDCENFGAVTGNKQNVGGIVGWQSLGLVKTCTNTGRVDAAAADRVGGVCGSSSGFIRNCFANCKLSGDTYVGGIAGSGTIVTDSIAHVQFSGSKERTGGIMGWADAPLTETQEPIRGNYYLPTDRDIGAVDGVSYDAQAQPLALKDFLALETLPDIFKTAKVSFCFDDGTVQDVKVPLGGKLLDSQIPELPEKPDFHCHWTGLETADLTNILFDMQFQAEYMPYTTVIASSATRSDGRPILLLEGSFACDDEVSVIESNAAPTVEQGQNVIESWEITAQQGGHQARFLLTDPSVAENVIAYACWGDGKWQQLTFHQNGSYLVFPMEAEYMQIALVQEAKDVNLWYIAGAAALAVLVIVTVVIIRKKRHSQSNTAENAEA